MHCLEEVSNNKKGERRFRRLFDPVAEPKKLQEAGACADCFFFESPESPCPEVTKGELLADPEKRIAASAAATSRFFDRLDCWSPQGRK